MPMGEVILTPMSRQQKPYERLQNCGKRARGKLPRAVGIAQLKAHDAGIRLIDAQAFDQLEDPLKKAPADADIGIEKKEPVALAQAAAFVDRLSEAAIAFPAPEGDRRHPAYCFPEGMRRRMIVHNDDFDFAAPGAHGGRKLANELRRFPPQAVIDNDDRESDYLQGGLDEPKPTSIQLARPRGTRASGHRRQGHRVPSLMDLRPWIVELGPLRVLRAEISLL